MYVQSEINVSIYIISLKKLKKNEKFILQPLLIMRFWYYSVLI